MHLSVRATRGDFDDDAVDIVFADKMPHHRILLSVYFIYLYGNGLGTVPFCVIVYVCALACHSIPKYMRGQAIRSQNRRRRPRIGVILLFSARIRRAKRLTARRFSHIIPLDGFDGKRMRKAVETPIHEKKEAV